MTGSTDPVLGILGGGQLGRMIALAALPLGVRCRILDPAPGPHPAAAVAEVVPGSWDDPRALDALANGSRAVTIEVENVPVAALEYLSQRGCPVRPQAAVLEIAADRLAEKSLFSKVGLAVAPHAAVDGDDDYGPAMAITGLPALLKLRRSGFDGRGQHLVRSADGLAAAHAQLGGRPCILEALVEFARELAVIVVRGGDGEMRTYPVVETQQADGQMARAIAPAPRLPPDARDAADAAGRAVALALDHRGVLALELFETNDGLIANEMAPRVHNSGHWTIEGAHTSQFENHVRAVLGLPLGSTAMRGNAAVINVIGTRPETPAVLAVGGAHLHLYGKGERPGRKLGHVTVTADNPTERDQLLEQVAAALRQPV